MAAKYPSALDDEDLRDIPPEELDQPCQDKHLCQVAREITNWPFLAPFLGIKLSEVEAIRGRWPYDVTAQKLELLRQWQHKHQRKGKDTYRNLRKAFLQAQEATLADKVCDVLRGQGNSSEDSSDESIEASVESSPPKVEFQLPPSTSHPKMNSKELRKVSRSALYCTDPPTATTSKIGPLKRFSNYLCSKLGIQAPPSSTNNESDPLEFQLPPSTSRPKMKSKEVREISSSALYLTDPSTRKIDSLELFADYLRTTYGVQVPGFVVLQWPPPPTLKVFNLAMIRSRQIVRRQLPTEELVRLMQRGNVSSAIQGSTSIQLENLFRLKDRERKKRKVVLIEGAPGAGKSTLAWHICQKWKAQELFQEFKVVIHVQLRDPRIQQATSLADLLPTDSEETRRDVTTHIKSCLGKGVLFVLDGWDEFEPGLEGFVGKLICSPEIVRLQCSTLLITSRPIASRELQRYASSRVEIVGFTQGEVFRYFEEALGDPLAVQNLQGQLRERPVIEASCYLPLNAAIVVHLFMELNHTLPTTLHGVFSAVVCGCIRRHLKRKSGKEEEIPSLDELPPDMQEGFQSICTLAYEGSMVNKVTFSGQDLRSYGLSAELNVLDLMQVVRNFASHKSTLSHFLHLSVQELLTALHISKLPPPEQVRIFNEVFDNPRFAAVFCFYAAFTKLQTEGIRDVVARFACGVRQRCLNLMHCLYEADDVSLCCFVASQLKTGLNLDRVTLSPLDCLTVGYFLSCIPPNTTGEFKVNLVDSSLDDYSVSFLAKGLSKYVCSTPGVEGSSSHDPPPPGQLALDLCNNKLRGVGVRYLSDLISHHNVISKLDLSRNKIQEREDGFKHLLQVLRTNTSVVRLVLFDCHLRIEADSCPLLVEMLQENKTLKDMNLNWNFMSDKALLALGEGLRKNRGLATLNMLIQSEGAGVGAWQQFVLCLKENRHLTELIMRNRSTVRREIEVVNETRRQQGLPLLQVWQ